MEFKIKWWQLIPYELAVLALGIFIGTYFHHFFSNFLYSLITIFIIAGGYILYVLISQIKSGGKDNDNY